MSVGEQAGAVVELTGAAEAGSIVPRWRQSGSDGGAGEAACVDIAQNATRTAAEQLPTPISRPRAQTRIWDKEQVDARSTAAG
jgi:hypothetical protein